MKRLISTTLALLALSSSAVIAGNWKPETDAFCKELEKSATARVYEDGKTFYIPGSVVDKRTVMVQISGTKYGLAKELHKAGDDAIVLVYSLKRKDYVPVKAKISYVTENAVFYEVEAVLPTTIDLTINHYSYYDPITGELTTSNTCIVGTVNIKR